jgi:hypothetical protein
MGLKETLAEEIEITRRDFHHLLDSVPEAQYLHPSHNPAWTNGDVLYHIALGMMLIHYEVWLTLHARGLLQLGLNMIPAKMLNGINAGFARKGKQVTHQMLLKVYERGHTGLRSGLKQVKEDDFGRWITVPPELDIILSGKVTIERLYQHVKIHFDAHTGQIKMMSLSRKDAEAG